MAYEYSVTRPETNWQTERSMGSPSSLTFSHALNSAFQLILESRYLRLFLLSSVKTHPNPISFTPISSTLTHCIPLHPNLSSAPPYASTFARLKSSATFLANLWFACFPSAPSLLTHAHPRSPVPTVIQTASSPPDCRSKSSISSAPVCVFTAGVCICHRTGPCHRSVCLHTPEGTCVPRSLRLWFLWEGTRHGKLTHESYGMVRFCLSILRALMSLFILLFFLTRFFSPVIF